MAAAKKGARRDSHSEGGKVLADRYRLDELLGRGGTADVFKSTDLRLGRLVAVKRFRRGASAVTEDRFCEEATLLARLQHPGLVTVYDAGRNKHGAFVVMALIDGVTLRERIAAGPLPPSHVVRLGARLAEALAHVHAVGIVHRDVKPSNVLLDEDGDPHLADFGISRPTNTPTRAEAGTLVGTAAYMAPEQVLGKGAGPASDIYALGLVLLECLKGEREFHGEPREACLARLLRPPELTGFIPEQLVPVVRSMTHIDPHARPDAAHCAHLLLAATSRTAAHDAVGSGFDTSTQSWPGADAADAADAKDPGPSSRAPRQHGRRAVALSIAVVVLSAIGAILALTAGSRPPGPPDDVRTPATGSANPASTPSPRSTPSGAPPTIPFQAAPIEPDLGKSSAAHPGTGHGKPKGKAKGKPHG